MNLKIIPGEKFYKLTVLGEGQRLRLPSGQTNRTIQCVCECGSIKSIRLLHLVRGRIRSCGCIKKTQKGLSGEKLFKVWKGMHERCDGKVGKSPMYVVKNIKVCEEWKEFEPFFIWAKVNGYDKGLQIDRIDNSKGYAPENCRFVTPQDNCNNRDNTVFVEYEGKKISLRDLLNIKNLMKNYPAIASRIKRGVPMPDAIDRPIRKGNYKRRID